MHFIRTHNFIENEHGEFGLVFDKIASTEPKDSVFMVSADGNKAYLRRAPNDIYGFVEIDDDIIERIRKIGRIMIVELKDKTIAYNYDAQAGILEDEDDEDFTPG